MNPHPLEESLLWWGLVISIFMMLFYIGIALWVVAVLIHDKAEQRKEARNAREHREQNNDQG